VVDISKELPKERSEFIIQFAQKIPLKRMGSPEDMANAVLFLSSDRADYITGQVIVVDGGMSIKM
jgi:3-oxoacyl-[acyl-carrier protein] reductase